MQTASLRSFRLVCQPEEIPMVEALLEEQGYRFEPEPFSPLARRLIAEPRPLGSSIAAFFGLIYIQDRSSMLPPIALHPAQGDAVLDMCASPGSKTGFLAQLVGKNGFVLGNEPSKNRLATLRQNLFTLNLLQAGTCSYSGEQLPLPSASWDMIQLDPPCSGWGTVERNPNVLKLWQGDKIKPLVTLQRQLLAEAGRLLRPGGKVVFSTCTTNVDENEAQVRFAVEELGFILEPLEAPAGFVLAEPELPNCEGVLRVDPQASEAQGFFVAAFRRPHDAVTFPNAILPSEPSEAKASGKQKKQRLSQKQARPRTEEAFVPFSAPAIHPESLDQAGVTSEALPEGQISIFGDTARFLPAAALERLPKGFAWQGCALGKAAQHGEIRVFPRLRALMPSVEEAASTGALAIDIDKLSTIQGLLSGQSMSLSPDNANKSKEACLYWRGLRLCRLRLKGDHRSLRAMWSER